jgi:hypothetical protein
MTDVECYKRGGKAKKPKKPKTKKAKKANKTKSRMAMAPPVLGMGSLGVGQGSYTSTPVTSGTFAGPSYFRAVGPSDQMAVVPPVLRDFVEQQKKLWEDLKRGKPMETPPAPVASSSSSTPDVPPIHIPERAVNSPIYGMATPGRGSPELFAPVMRGYDFPPASGLQMVPEDRILDAPNSQFIPLHGDRPESLSESAAMSSYVGVPSQGQSSTRQVFPSTRPIIDKNKEEAVIPRFRVKRPIMAPPGAPIYSGGPHQVASSSSSSSSSSGAF